MKRALESDPTLIERCVSARGACTAHSARRSSRSTAWIERRASTVPVPIAQVSGTRKARAAQANRRSRRTRRRSWRAIAKTRMAATPSSGCWAITWRDSRSAQSALMSCTVRSRMVARVFPHESTAAVTDQRSPLPQRRLPAARRSRGSDVRTCLTPRNVPPPQPGTEIVRREAIRSSRRSTVPPAESAASDWPCE
jgi:hypothetical protein